MARRYDVDYGAQRLTLADSQCEPDPGATVRQWAPNQDMPSVPECIGNAAHAWWVCDQIEEAWTLLCAHTTDVHAAGGLLTHPNGSLLCIHRLGHWDLPKGKVEAGESLDEAAAREVHEECGIPMPLVGQPFAKTQHIYGPGDSLMKVTHWYSMTVKPGSENTALIPQTEEGITQVRWASKEEVKGMEPQAFGNIARLMALWRAIA